MSSKKYPVQGENYQMPPMSQYPIQGEMYQMPMYPTQSISPMPNYPVQAEMYQAPVAPMPTHYVCPVNPYVVQTLCTLIGHKVVIETVRDKHVGKLIDVKPDHIVLESMHAVFFIRIQEIVSIMPIRHCHHDHCHHGHHHKKHCDNREVQND